MILANKIIEERKKLGLSQEELAEKLSVSRQAVSKWESAQSIPDLQKIIAMSQLFSVSTDYLLKDDCEPEPAVCAPETQDANEPTRKVSLQEANAYMATMRTQSFFSLNTPAKPNPLATCTKKSLRRPMASPGW